jgi:hypothetical protein
LAPVRVGNLRHGHVGLPARHEIQHETCCTLAASATSLACSVKSPVAVRRGAATAPPAWLPLGQPPTNRPQLRTVAPSPAHLLGIVTAAGVGATDPAVSSFTAADTRRPRVASVIRFAPWTLQQWQTSCAPLSRFVKMYTRSSSAPTAAGRSESGERPCGVMKGQCRLNISLDTNPPGVG